MLIACRQLKADGFGLVVGRRRVKKINGDPLLELADIARVDFASSGQREVERIVSQLAPTGVRLLAGQIQTGEDYIVAVDLGFDYVQGYFFCEPQIVEARDIPASRQTIVRFLREVNRPAVDFDLAEEAVKQDVSLSFKLLRYLNSASVGLGAHVELIKQALVLLGERPLRKWASLVALTCLAQDKPAELIITTLVRARFCELLADTAQMADREFELFMTGLFSTLDVLLDRELDEVLMELPLSIDVKAALLGSASPLGRMLMLAIARERGEKWQDLAESLHLSQTQITAAHEQAIVWAHEVL